ncbi:MAG: homoserine dehydrogenase [bacterium]
MSNKITKIGLLGFGTVGREVFRILQEQKEYFARKMEYTIEVKSICVKDITKDRGIDKKYFTTDYESIAHDPEIDIIIELMGDCPEALEAIQLALQNKNSVVTANKAIMARHAKELFELAKVHDAEILFEASVAGAIPVLRSIREGLAANQIQSLYGIINGTANYILTKMTQEGADYADVLKEAQEKGYAEADPTADVMGHDAAYKLSILAMLCHGKIISVDDVFCRGIHYIKSLDIEMADKFGYVIKLLGITKVNGDHFEARVHPTMINKANPLAHVNGAYNAIEYKCNYAGDGMLYGLGAGGTPTAAAVVSDVIELVHSIRSENRINLQPSGFLSGSLVPAKPIDIQDLNSRYYVRFSVMDKPNVLSRITTVLGKNNISVQHLYQHGADKDQTIPLIIFTHDTLERDIRQALRDIDKMDFITQTTKIIRIEE